MDDDSGDWTRDGGEVAAHGVTSPTPYAHAMDAFSSIVDAVADTDRLINSAMAWRARLIDGARRMVEATELPAVASPDDPVPWSAAERARRVVVSELAVAMRLPERTVQGLLTESRALVEDLPATLSAMRAGDVSYRHAQRIVDHALSLPVEARAGFEAAVVPVAVTQSVAKLDHRARKVRERVHPASVNQRHTAAVEDRCLLTEPARDGMAWLHLYLAADRAAAVFDRVDRTARAPVPDDGLDPHITLTQRRADVAMELLLGPSTGAPAAGTRDQRVRATVHVTVPVLTLMGHDDGPGELAGYGPIDADTARRLAGTASSWTRILTHPVTGTVLDVDRTSYAVPKDLQRYLQVRDETCRFPNCSRTAERCDLDHAVDWTENGRTAHDNLAHLCRPHHRLKHQTGWRLKHLAHGQFRWTSPTGRVYTTEPATIIRR